MCVYRVELESKGLEGQMHMKREKMAIRPYHESDYLDPIHSDQEMKSSGELEWIVFNASDDESFYSNKGFSTTPRSKINPAEKERYFRFFRG